MINAQEQVDTQLLQKRIDLALRYLMPNADTEIGIVDELMTTTRGGLLYRIVYARDTLAGARDEELSK